VTELVAVLHRAAAWRREPRKPWPTTTASLSQSDIPSRRPDRAWSAKRRFRVNGPANASAAAASPPRSGAAEASRRTEAA